jgi:type I restriction enzyme M protein
MDTATAVENGFPDVPSSVDLSSPKVGKTCADRNANLFSIIQKIAEGLFEFSTDINVPGDAYEYVIGQFAAGIGKMAGEFYTPQQIRASPCSPETSPAFHTRRERCTRPR